MSINYLEIRNSLGLIEHSKEETPEVAYAVSIFSTDLDMIEIMFRELVKLNVDPRLVAYEFIEKVTSCAIEYLLLNTIAEAKTQITKKIEEAKAQQ